MAVIQGNRALQSQTGPLILGGLRPWSQVKCCPQVLRPHLWISSALRDKLFVGHPSLFPRDTGMGRVKQELGMPSLLELLICLSAHPGAPQLLAMVQRQVPGAQLVKELPHELVLVLPYGGSLDGSFAQLFHELDQRLGELGLAGYGISDTSLEEVRLLAESCLEEVACGRSSLLIDCRAPQGGGRRLVKA